MIIRPRLNCQGRVVIYMEILPRNWKKGNLFDQKRTPQLVYATHRKAYLYYITFSVFFSFSYWYRDGSGQLNQLVCEVKRVLLLIKGLSYLSY